MKSKAIIPLALGAVVGLVAIKFAVDTLQKASGGQTVTVPAVVALVDIPQSVEITSDMVQQVETPKTPLVPEGGFVKAEDVVGRVTSKSIPTGAVIAPQSLAPPGTPPGLTERIPEGYRAVSVRIDDVSGVSGQIKPDDFVDVIVVMRVERGKDEETISRIILQRVKVIAVGQNLGGAAESGGPQQMARACTLLIRDADVPKLHLAQTQGKVTLAMRGAEDRLIGEPGFASTSLWAAPDEPTSEPAVDGADSPVESGRGGLPSPAERVGMALAQGGPAGLGGQFSVTVMNGPLRRDDGTAVQRITYASRDSMKVVSVEVGRSSQGSSSSADSAETIMRAPRGGSDGEGNAGRGLSGAEVEGEPRDREIDPE